MVLCRSQTAIKLTHILAFCVYIQDDDVCKQWGKKNRSSGLRSWQKSFPSLPQRQSPGTWPELWSGAGTIAIALSHPVPGEARAFPQSPIPILSQTRCWAVTTCCVASRSGSAAARVPDLPEFRHTWCSPIPPHPFLPCANLPASFMALKSQLQLSGCFLHNLYYTRSKIFNIAFLALVSYLPHGLFSLSAPLYLQIHHPKSYPGVFCLSSGNVRGLRTCCGRDQDAGHTVSNLP